MSEPAGIMAAVREVEQGVVRRARDDELEDAGAVVVAAYRADGLGGEPGYLEVVGDARSRAPDGEVLVAVGGSGEVLGSVTYARHGSPLAEVSADGEAEFRMLGVAPSAQGRGVGRALVLGCIEQARRDGARRLMLSTQRQSAVAHRLYERLGFVRAPEQDWSPSPGVDLLVYSLELAT